MAAGLTLRQKDCLDYIKAYLADNGVAPSYDEMKYALDLRSKSGVHRLVLGLEGRGYITRSPVKARSIVVSGGFQLPPDLAARVGEEAFHMGLTVDRFLEFALTNYVAAKRRHRALWSAAK